MRKLFENLFFKPNKSHFAVLPGRTYNKPGRNEKNKDREYNPVRLPDDYEEVKTNSDTDDWSSLNFMQWFIEEPTNGETPPTGNNESIKSGGDGKHNSSDETDPSNDIDKIQIDRIQIQKEERETDR